VLLLESALPQVPTETETIASITTPSATGDIPEARQ